MTPQTPKTPQTPTRDGDAPPSPDRSPRRPSRPPRHPLTRLLDFVGSVPFGIVILALLFIYCSIGSSGVPVSIHLTRPETWVSVREIFELSEFQWFHWWPFDVLIALLCISLVTTTLRRIPLNVINLGVWMIHTGIIVLALGSVWYFSTKVEGDAPVARRQVVAQVPGAEAVRMIAKPGNQVQVGSGADAYTLQVMGITPDWELLSGDDEGQRTYKVSVMVQSAEQTFIRELLAGYPQYTEDLVRSDDPQQPFARAKKTLGVALVDDTIRVALDYAPQEWFYVRESTALYLREVGSTEWIERPIRRLPRFKDHIASYDDVFAPAQELPPLRPLDVTVPPADERDPLPGVDLRISSYLRYATMRSQRRHVAGGPLDPWIAFDLHRGDGQAQSFELNAFDPAGNTLGGGAVSFDWVGSPAEVDALKVTRAATLRVTLGDEGFAADLPITDVVNKAGPTGALEEDLSVPFVPIGDTPYRYRVRSAEDNLDILGRTVSVAIVEIKREGRDTEPFTRWVFDDPALTRDIAPGGSIADHMSGELIDPNLALEYLPRAGGGLRILAGPGEGDLRLLIPRDGSYLEQPVAVGESVEIRPGIWLTIDDYAPRSALETRPYVVPPNQRDGAVGVQASMVRIHVPTGGPNGTSVRSEWLNYHLYPFARPQDVLVRFPYDPVVVHLADGRHVEVLFSRERHRLPAPVVLEDFELTTHIGGYAGNNASVRDWTSVVRFGADDGWSGTERVSVNAPRERDGFWFFQSQWDPPIPPRGNERGSAGLNYTVLGVGNREGVVTQLLGCCLSVIGMIYAFYVKPAIRRRRQLAAYAVVEARAVAGAGANGRAANERAQPELAAAGAEETT